MPVSISCRLPSFLSPKSYRTRAHHHNLVGYKKPLISPDTTQETPRTSRNTTNIKKLSSLDTLAYLSPPFFPASRKSEVLMLLPLSNASSSPEPQIKKPKTPPDFQRKDSFKSPKAFLAAHYPSFNQPRICLFLSVFFIQILLLIAFRSLPLSSHHRRQHFPSPFSTRHHHHLNQTVTTITTATTAPSTVKEESSCEFGKIFVYNLPSALNKELVSNCDELNPWSSSCAACRMTDLAL
jgi:hypothetical protein